MNSNTTTPETGVESLTVEKRAPAAPQAARLRSSRGGNQAPAMDGFAMCRENGRSGDILASRALTGVEPVQPGMQVTEAARPVSSRPVASRLSTS